MSEPGPPPGEAPDLHRQLGELAAQIDALRQELASLSERLADEVRTRRLTVVDGDGFERVVAVGRGHYGHVTVRGRTPEGRSTAVELFANDPVDGDGANVGLSLSDRGDVVACFDVTQGEAVSLWVADEEGGGGEGAHG